MSQARADPNRLGVSSSVNPEMSPPNRGNSAPPILGMDSSTAMFAYHPSKETDIRANEDYSKFYQMYNDTHKLPAPLETPFNKPVLDKKTVSVPTAEDETVPLNDVGAQKSPTPPTPTVSALWMPLTIDDGDARGNRGERRDSNASAGVPPQFDPSFLQDGSPRVSYAPIPLWAMYDRPQTHPRDTRGPMPRVAHVPADPRTVTNAYLIGGVCRFFLNGDCPRGDSCPYPHGEPFAPVGLGLRKQPDPRTERRADPRGGHPRYDRDDGRAPHGRGGDRRGGGEPRRDYHRDTPYFGYPPVLDARDFMPPSPSEDDFEYGFKQGRSRSAVFNHYGRPAPMRPPSRPSYPPHAPPMAVTSPPPFPARSPRLPVALSKSPPPDASRFTSLEQVRGQILQLCKDQHGCRFLQKKLDECADECAGIIFLEVQDFMSELMIDPFGNYLCQKLFECCNDFQRLKILENVSSDLVTIALNMHGTRAVQKMVEFLSTMEQVDVLTQSLRGSVVLLIKDLNGNHVIQRCLSKLSAEENQFIYDAVVMHCVEVATHRHGCCVLQRCLDHASEQQRAQLVDEITQQAMALVQDAFGNYVVQYVLDLNVVEFSDSLTAQFLGHIIDLAVQKFSSNVIEKCLKLAGVAMRTAVVLELCESEKLSRLLSDPFGNYVVQTALAVATPALHNTLVQKIRPHSALLRNTPYGKRILHKIQNQGGKRHK